MKVLRTVESVRRWRRSLGPRSVGFVPTMGDLHAGHLSLVAKSRSENAATALSIFVNPAQFDRRSDFKKYHRAVQRDLALAQRSGADAVFLPTEKELYPEGFQTWVSVDELSKPLCGKFRPGHFRGVATVVLKLFNIVQPHRAYFGLKDYQQYRLIERMVRDLDVPVKVVACPIVREPSGLAMSSRNRRLSSKKLKDSARIFAALQSVGEMLESRQRTSASALRARFKKALRLGKGDRVEYVEVVHPETLTAPRVLRAPVLIAAAVWIGGTRLIDNLLVQRR